VSTQRTVLIESQDTPIAQTTLYTSTNATSAIDAMTATNTTGAIQKISVNLVPFGGAVGANNLLVSQVSIAAGGSYQFPELVGHVLAAGDFISVLATATGITLRASGRVTTAN
jgi:hypothetical protein